MAGIHVWLHVRLPIAFGRTSPTILQDHSWIRPIQTECRMMEAVVHAISDESLCRIIVRAIVSTALLELLYTTSIRFPGRG